MTNPHCPAYESHQENAYDHLASEGLVTSDRFSLTADENAMVEALAMSEYLACEGH